MKQNKFLYEFLFLFLAFLVFTPFSYVNATDPVSAQGSITINVPAGFTGPATVNVTVVGNGGVITSLPIILTITPATPPTPPINLSVSPSSCGNNWLNISWSSNGADSYQVTRDGATLVYNSSGISFSDTGLALGSSHSYTVRAVNSFGSSAQSSSVSNMVANACGGNTPPNVSAGVDKPITLPTNSTSVTGTASDSDGFISWTSWTKISGPATYSISSPSALTTNITNLSTAGTYVFRLTATDNLGATNYDDMQVVVNSAATPTFSIQPSSASITVGQTATFSANYDPDGAGAQASQNVTDSASWGPADIPNCSAVSNDVVTKVGNGQYRSVAPGSACVQASYSGLNSAASVTVTAPDLTAGAPSPATAVVGTPLAFTTTISNTGTAATGASFNNFFQVATAANGGGTVSALSVNSRAALAAGANGPVTSSSYTFPSSGTYSVRTCADNNASWVGTITESNEGNNCGGWTNVVVSVVVPPPTCTSAAPEALSTTAVSGTFYVYAYGVQNATLVRFAVWGDPGGQDDFVWYPGTDMGGGTWRASINLANHKTGNPEYGTFNVHGYMNNASFIDIMCGASSFTRTFITVPTVTTTTPVTNITQTTATGGGNVTSNGGGTVTISGIAWSTSVNPTTANTKTTDGWAIGGPWISGMTGLTANTLYHVRAYATNSAGTAYGSDVTFTTLPISTCVGGGTGTGLTGKYYDGMNFDSLVTTRVDSTINSNPADSLGVSYANSPDGDTFSIRWEGQVQPRCTENYTFYTLTDDGARLWINGSQVISQWVPQGPTEVASVPITLTAGTKYDIKMEFYEATGGSAAQLLWSSPSTAKAIIPQAQLYPLVVATGNLSGRVYSDNNHNFALDAGEPYVRSSATSCGATEVQLSGALINYSGPTSGSVPINLCNGAPYYEVNLPPGTYSVSLSGLPAGWTISAPNPASVTITSSGNFGVWFIVYPPVAATIPTVTTTTPVTNITQTTATGGGNVTSNGGATVTVSGIVWSTGANPTYGGGGPGPGQTTDGWAIGGPWTSNITGLSTNTLYHVRAYAVNSVGTAYGSDVTFTTSGPAPVPGVCGTANGKTYSYGASIYGSDTLCSVGTFNPPTVSPPAPGGTANWTCLGLNGGGYSGVCSASQDFPPSSVTITADKPRIVEGGSATLTWNGGSGTCTASGGWSGTKATSGSFAVSPTVTTTYTITCANNESDFVTVIVSKKPIIIEN